MSFRLKTIIGVALIEGCLLLFLVWSGINYLRESNEKELTLRAQLSAESIANLTRDAILASDLARIDSVAQRALESSEVVYVRISDSERVLSQSGGAAALQRPFVHDSQLADAQDGVYDVAVDLAEGDYRFGRVELGISVARANALIADAQRHLSVIAVAEMVLVALFSYLLGAYLTRGLQGLTQAARSISSGALGATVDVKGSDELAETGRAFNAMSVRLAESQRVMERNVAESLALSTRLAEKEQRLATILDTAVDGFVTIDRHGTIDDINVAGAALFGYRVSELVGRNVSCLMPESDSVAHDGHMQRYLDTGVAHVVGRARRVSGLRKDGSTFPMDLSVSEMEVGGQRMFVGLVRDLSEQLQAEAAVRKSEAMRAAVVAANLDALVTVDADDRVVEFSAQAEKMFGYAREAVMGRPMGELLIPTHMRERHREGMKRFLATGEGPVIGQRIEVPALSASGDTFPVELTVQPIDVEGELYFTALIRDISERKAEEQALRDAKHRAEAASEAKSRFLAHMSHEIRSPLNAVLGSLGLLLDDQLSKDQRLYAKTAEASGRILLSLINDVLDFSKIEAGRVVLENAEFAVGDLVNETMDLVAFKARDKGIYVAAVIEPGVSDWVRGDETRLRQILSNLADNALKFTERGSVILRVEAAGGEEGRLRFTVEDTGIGIAPEAQAALFDEFQQVDSSDSTRHGGSGLGLSICQGLATLMGGSIGLHSVRGAGSRFWLDVALPPAKGPATAEDEPSSAFRRALAVGFSPVLADALQAMCAGAGCRVATAEGVDAAVDALQAPPEAGQASRPDGPAQVLLADGQLGSVELDRLAGEARAAGVQRLLLLAPASSPRLVERVAGGQYDDLVLSPVVMHHLAASLQPAPPGGAAAAGEGASPTEAPLATPRGPRILLAEDSVANQLVATALLRRAGYRVEVANNGREAVECFAAGGHDLVLMDLRMPEMDGLEATAAIRALPGGARVPIVAMTANALQQDVDRCMAAGMDDFVPKPVDRAQLLEALARHLPAVPLTDLAGAGERVPEAVADEADEPLIDEDVIRQLGEDVTEAAVPGMLQMFVDEANTRAGNLLEALGDGPIQVIEDEAHTLKSCAGTFGATRLHALARDIEAACREGNRPAAENLGGRMQGLLQQTLAAYRVRFGFLADAKGGE